MQNIYDWRPEIDNLGGRKRENFPDIHDENFWQMYDVGKRYSMIHITGFFNIFASVKYLSENRIPGDFVECGVWLGGASIFAGLCFKHFGQHDRKIYLYDTFTGFPKNSTDVRDGVAVKGPSYANFRQAVESNIKASGIAQGAYEIVEGPVEETLADGHETDIGILRLDTDHYSSTAAEMRVLFPKLVEGGVLIVDDYGSYEGSRRAVDEYLLANNRPLMLTRVDKGVRTAIKN